MSQTKLPVVVHRWFLSGEGWAFHPAVEPALSDFIRAVENRLLSRPTARERFCDPFGEGQLVGDIFPDEDCSNSKYVGRNPSILRVAYSDRRLSSCEAEGVYHRLVDLALPEDDGPDEQLEIQLPHESPVVFASTEAEPGDNLGNVHADIASVGRTWYAEWGLIAALWCVVASMAYSSSQGGDLVRLVLDYMLGICLSGTLFHLVLRHQS